MQQEFSNPKITEFLEAGNFLDFLDNKIFYQFQHGRSETSPTVLLIHGFPTSSWDWQEFVTQVGNQWNIILVDMLGFGFSSKPNRRGYTIKQQADIHQALLGQLKIEKTHIVCHDYGVSVAQELLARQIDDKQDIGIQSVTFLNGGLFPETHRALLIQKLMLSSLGRYLNRFLGFPQFKKSFASVFGAQTKPTEDDLRDFWEIIHYNQGKHVFHNLITYILDRKEHRERWLRGLQQSNIPLALINGSQDPVSGAHLVTRYRELGCRLDALTELQHIGHYPQVEDGHAVANAWLNFQTKI
ncbi:MAG: alpha/beta hydrolase [Pseudomonadota bacterium]